MRFSPAQIGRRVVPVWVTLPIHFDFEPDEPTDSAATPRQPPPGAPPAAPARPVASAGGRGGMNALAHRSRPPSGDDGTGHTEARA
jgi:hypothetical protein